MTAQVMTVDPEKRRINHEKLNMGNLDVVRRNPYAIKDNLLLDDLEIAVEEVNAFAALGGETIVDCTSIGINRDPEKLLELARSTGLNIVAGSGYYTHDTHPAEMDQWSPEKIAEKIICDLTAGIDETDIRAGVIGEIGTSDPIQPNEKKSLLTAALAFRQVPAAIYVHIYPWGQGGLEAVDLLFEQQVNPAKIVICHSDVAIDLDYINALLTRGVFVEFDNFGKEFTLDRDDRGFAGGVFARDIYLKCMLHYYGGWGYDHILRNIVPMIFDEGIPGETIDTFLRGNPKRLLGSSL